MNSDIVWGFALGLSCGIGIGMLILAAYHDHVVKEIDKYDEEWTPNYEALKASYDMPSLAEPLPDIIKHAQEPMEVIKNLTPAEWKRDHDRTKR